MAFSSSVSSSGTSSSASLCVSFSVALGLADSDWSEDSVKGSVGPLPDGAVSEVGFEADDSSDVMSELEGCKQGDERICDVVSLATGSGVLIFESGASKAFSLFACLVPL